MSVASSPDYLFRPGDRALQMLFPSVEEGNNFDEFFNEELYNSSQHQEDSNESPDDLSSEQPYVSDYPRLPSLSGPTTQERSSPQPWRKGLWCLNQAKPPKLNVEKTRKIGMGTISTAHLVINDNFATRSSRSPAVPPAVNTTKRFATSPNAANYAHKAHPPISISREATLSPGPMYAQLPIQSKMEQVETWQQDFQNFHLRMPQQSSSTSPTNPSKLRHGMAARQINAPMVAQNAGIGMALTTYDEFPNLGEDFDVHNGLDPSRHTGSRTNTLSSPTNHNNATMHHLHDHQQTPVWTTESLHSSNSSHQSYETMPHSSHSGHSGRSAHDMFGGQVQNWWSPPRGTGNPRWNLPHQDQYPSIIAPAPQRAPAPIVVQNLGQPSGLGIQYPELEQIDQAILDGQHQFYPDFPSVSNLPYSPIADMTSHGIPPVPPLPFRSTNKFTNPSPFTTPRKQRRSPSRSPSPSLSPTNTSTRTLCQRSPTRTEYQHSHRRRKSIHKSGPIRDGASEPVPAGSVRARSRSTSKAPRTPRTPKNPTRGFRAVDFVNFTPRDSAKLLSDVAPSGSSKTRARREAEAREKRKKLSEAALKAVSSAGGDVEAVKKAILT